MNGITGYPIEDIISGGFTDDGLTIHFSFRFKDGTEATFLCPHQKIGPIFAYLSKFSELAFKERAKADPTLGKPDGMEVAEAFKIQDISVGIAMKQGEDPRIVLRFQTEKKFSIDLALLPDQVRNTIELLQEKLNQIPEVSKRKLH